MSTYRCRLIDCEGTPVDAVVTTSSLEEASNFIRKASELLPGWGYELWEGESLVISTAPQHPRGRVGEIRNILNLLTQAQPSKYIH